ncbi:MAG: NYN domain-containing protein [Verrucomicrobiae bacterium]|nr:NYN domain-containing protein [Verrucomicrobiae bacterium]
MTARWVLVDGYSVLHAWPAFQTRRQRARGFVQKRDELIGVLARYADHTGDKLTIVFDGYAARHQPETAPVLWQGIEVLYSEAGRTADDVIERLVSLLTPRYRVIVITDDHAERRTVESLGADAYSCEWFADEVARTLHDLDRTLRHQQRQPRRTRLGDVW